MTLDELIKNANISLEEKKKLKSQLNSLYDDQLFLETLMVNGLTEWEWYDAVVDVYDKELKKILEEENNASR